MLLPALGGILVSQGNAPADLGTIWKTLGLTLLQVGVFVCGSDAGGRPQVFPWMLWQVQRTGSRELFTLCVVAAAVSVAFGATLLFGVSFALGAFFAGMVMRESEFGHRAAEESLPLRDAFAVLFFVSVGMLFDPWVVLERPLQVLAVVAIIIVGKSLAAGVLVLALRYRLNTALTVSASLAQIGGFSFIFLGLGASLGLLPPEGQSLVLAGALISIALNQLLFNSIGAAENWLLANSAFLRRPEARVEPTAQLPMETDSKYLAGHVVLVGYGKLGRSIAKVPLEKRIAFVVADQNRELVERLRGEAMAAVSGDATEPDVLIQAHIAEARVLVIATPNTLDVRQMIVIARTLNPSIQTIVRAHNLNESRLLDQETAGAVFLAEKELYLAITLKVLGLFEAEAAGAH